MRFHLGEEDRRKYGITEEWLHFDGDRLTVKEAALLQEAGFESVADWHRGLRGREVIENGAFVHVLDETGAPKLDEEQLPIVKRRDDYLALAALVWLCLRRAGVKVSWPDFDFDWHEFDTATDEVDEGKDGSADSSTS